MITVRSLSLACALSLLVSASSVLAEVPPVDEPGTCYECHDHDPQEDRRLHAQEGLDEIDACAGCHPTGAAGEAARYRAVATLDGDLPPINPDAGGAGIEPAPTKQLLRELPKEGRAPGPQGGRENVPGPDLSEGHPGSLNNP